MELQDLTHDVWSGLVGETFVVRLDDGATVDLSLTSAEMAPGDPARNGGAHSAFFAGPLDVFLPQRMWQMRHDAIGEQAIFLVPIGEDDDGYRYEAVFTHAPS